MTMTKIHTDGEELTVDDERLKARFGTPKLRALVVAYYNVLNDHDTSKLELLDVLVSQLGQAFTVCEDFQTRQAMFVSAFIAINENFIKEGAPGLQQDSAHTQH